jgi:hypothetical protein
MVIKILLGPSCKHYVILRKEYERKNNMKLMYRKAKSFVYIMYIITSTSVPYKKY